MKWWYVVAVMIGIPAGVLYCCVLGSKLWDRQIREMIHMLPCGKRRCMLDGITDRETAQCQYCGWSYDN